MICNAVKLIEHVELLCKIMKITKKQQKAMYSSIYVNV